MIVPWRNDSPVAQLTVDDVKDACSQLLLSKRRRGAGLMHSRLKPQTGAATAFTLAVVGLDQRNQPPSADPLSHLDQEQFLAGVRVHTSVFALAKVICLGGKFGERDQHISTEAGSLVQSFSIEGAGKIPLENEGLWRFLARYPL